MSRSLTAGASPPPPGITPFALFDLPGLCGHARTALPLELPKLISWNLSTNR
jgi:hypothetical protein